mmetsp:Transcript_55903/g.130898  ORF Transcript_55903/g.130898 Transcript_55903/m.130898 type:complete len:80 (-) Transcript_55903:92-331(-)
MKGDRRWMCGLKGIELLRRMAIAGPRRGDDRAASDFAASALFRRTMPPSFPHKEFAPAEAGRDERLSACLLLRLTIATL